MAALALAEGVVGRVGGLVLEAVLQSMDIFAEAALVYERFRGSSLGIFVAAWFIAPAPAPGAADLGAIHVAVLVARALPDLVWLLFRRRTFRRLGATARVTPGFVRSHALCNRVADVALQQSLGRYMPSAVLQPVPNDAEVVVIEHHVCRGVGLEEGHDMPHMFGVSIRLETA
jgi:hypothetical protein